MNNIILLVDDDAIELKWGEHFERDFKRIGDLLLLYENGKKALEDIEDGLNFHIAAIDYSLEYQKVNGRDITERVKMVKPNIPIINVSGYEKPEMIKACRELGIEILKKPFSFEEFARIVYNNLNQDFNSF